MQSLANASGLGGSNVPTELEGNRNVANNEHMKDRALFAHNNR